MDGILLALDPRHKEAGFSRADCVSALQTRLLRRLDTGLSCCHCLSGSGSTSHSQPLARRPGQSLPFSFFLLTHCAQRVFLVLSH